MKKITKWGIGLVMTLAMMFMVGQAGAVTLGLYETGQLVPKVYHDGTNVDTIISITCTTDTTVYWTFFDKDSVHVTNGYFEMTEDDYYGFSWMEESGQGLEGVEGYLVFTSGSGTPPAPTGTADIFANAFMLNLDARDAVVIPVLPLVADDYENPVDLEAMTATSIVSLASGIAPDTTLDIRYWIDPAFAASTYIVFWSICDTSGQHTVLVYNDEEDHKSVNLEFENEELNLVDPAIVPGMPNDFVDGFMRFVVPPVNGKGATCTSPEKENDMFVYSYVDSNTIGAMQTMLAGE